MWLTLPTLCVCFFLPPLLLTLQIRIFLFGLGLRCFLFQQRGRAKDPVAYLHDVEQRARERQVSYETIKLLRQDVIACYRKEGVNHYENCREVALKYYNVAIQKDVGQLQPDWSNPEMKDGW